MKIDIKELEKLIEIKFNNKNLLLHALTHKSYGIENKLNIWNERLEFLGDSVLSFIIVDYLYNKYKNLDEGVLSKIKSRLVSQKTLTVLAKKINLGKFILLSVGEEQTGGRDKGTILADTFEALLGAIYLDKGISVAKQFLIKLLPLKEVRMDIDYKSKLQEIVQKKYKTLPEYNVISETGPEHNKIFKIEVEIMKKVYGRGIGKNKKEAEQQAAKNTLEKLYKEQKI